jgi:AcrR family transcriptional regulator
MRRRAELVDETRLRITEATIRLHTTVGPANTSIASIAEEAGVTRLTVYRHFPDQDALFAACFGHWTAQNPPPDASAWLTVGDLGDRARLALGQLYAWFREHSAELYPNYRDADLMPISTQRTRRENHDRLAAALVAGIARDDEPGRRLRAVAGHVVSFWTWRSLMEDQGLDLETAVEIATAFLLGAVPAEPTRRAGNRRRPPREETGAGSPGSARD